MRGHWFIFVNVAAMLVLALIMAYRRSAKKEPNWPSTRTITVIAAAASVGMLFWAVFLSTRPPSLDTRPPAQPVVSAEERRLADWKPDPTSSGILDQYKRLINVPIGEGKEPEDYQPKFDPKAGEKYRYVSLNATYMGDERQKPICQLVEDYDVSVNRNAAGEVVIEEKPLKQWGLGFGAKEGTDTPAASEGIQLVVRNGDVYEQGVKSSASGRQGEPFRGPPRDRIAFDLPKDGKRHIGDVWTSVAKNRVSETTMNHKLVGFATVQGVVTAKYVSEGKISVFAEEIKKLLAQKQPKSVSIPLLPDVPPTVHKTVTYVDVMTGMVVRAESEDITQVGSGTGLSKTTAVTVTQRVSY